VKWAGAPEAYSVAWSPQGNFFSMCPWIAAAVRIFTSRHGITQDSGTTPPLGFPAFPLNIQPDYRYVYQKFNGEWGETGL